MTLFVFGQMSYGVPPTLDSLSTENPGSSDTAGSQANPYMLKSYEDFITLQQYSQDYDCAGLYFKVDPNLKSDENTHYYGETEDEEGGELSDGIKYNLDLTGTDFVGFGSNVDKPFKGNIDGQGVIFRMDTNLICFMGTGASVDNLYINGTITNAKNVKLYGTDAGIGSVASIIIADENASSSSINISNVQVGGATQKIDTTATITGGKRSVGGLVGTIYGKKDDITVTIKQCQVLADISNQGYVEGSGNYNTDITTGNIQTNFPGFAGGLIGDVTSKAGNDKYINVVLNGYNKLSGNFKCTDNGVGGLIGHLASKVKVTLDGTADFEGMKSLKSKYDNVLRGYLIGSEAYSLSSTTAGFSVKMPTTSSVFNNVADIDMDTTTSANRCAGMIYNNLSIVDSMIEGKGTKEEPYLIKNADDMTLLSVVFCSAGYYGLNGFKNYPDVTDLTTTGLYSARLQYLRKASYRIDNDIDLTGKNVIRLNRSNEVSFYGNLEGKDKGDGTYTTLTQNMDTVQSQVALFPYVTSSANNTAAEYKNFNLVGSIKGRTHVSGLIWNIKETSNTKSITTTNFNFENISVQLNMSMAPTGAGMYLGGFIGKIDCASVSKDEPEFAFKNVSYNGDIVIENNYETYSGGLIGYFAPSVSSTGLYSKLLVDTYHYGGTFTASGNTSANLYHGSVLGYMKAGSSQNITVDNVSTTMYHTNTEINLNHVTVSDFTVNTVSKTSGYTASCIAGCLERVNLSMNQTNIGDTAINTKSCTVGATFGRASGIMNVNGFHMSNVTINRTSTSYSTSAFFIVGINNGLLNLSDYDVDDTCVFKGSINSYYCNEISGSNYMEAGNGGRYGGIINMNNDELSSYHGYEVKSKFYGTTNTETAVNPMDRMHYNLFKDTEDGFIKGTGTKENPIIIDTPAKLMMYYAFSYTAPTCKEIYLKYFGDISTVLTTTEKNPAQKNAKMINSIVNANVVFANDLDLSPEDYGYSYFPTNAHGGNIYGFSAYRYLADQGNAAPSDEEVMAACKDAISELDKGELSVYNTYKPVIHMDTNKINKDNTSNTGVYSYLDKTKNGYAYSTKNLYAGLFTNVTKCTVGIYNLKLTGNYYQCAWSTPRGGALITDSVYSNNKDTDAVTNSANVNIKYIDIGDVTVSCNYITNVNSNSGTGLLVDSITASTVNFDYITILPESKVKADALVGLQQSSTTVNAKTIFRHMDLNAAISNENVSAETEGNYSQPDSLGTANQCGLKYGLFFYYLKSGNSIYWYETEDEANPDVMTPGLISDKTGKRTKPNKDLLQNKKYAYKIIPVDVNPIISNITEGNGTKDDPFILENEGQLITLALCLKTNGENTTADEWYVGNKADYPGYDEGDSTTWGSADSNNYMKNSNAVEYMRTAFYKLKNDIDFTRVYRNPAPNPSLLGSVNNFCGIGTANIPFAGNLDGNGYTITLSNYTGSKTYNYGLFQYVSGVYVKDLTIKLDDTEGYNNNYILGYDSNTTYIGMVAAKCLGADNVLENVKINADVRVQTTSAKSSANVKAMVGGYFGCIDYGSVTLVNMQPDNLKNFKVEYNYTNAENTDFQGPLRSYYDGKNYINQYINGIAGKITGSYVVYSDDRSDKNPSQLDSSLQMIEATDESSINNMTVDNPVTVNDMKYENDYGLRPFLTSNVINENWLQSAGKLKVSKNDDGGYYVDLANEKQLYILGLAVKSGSMSASTKDISSVNPYYKNAKTWKSDANWCGQELTNPATDYNCDYPSIFQYFEFDTGVTYKDMMVNGYSVLNNVASNANSNDTRTTYRLTKNDQNYDMSTLQEFVGIGDNTYSNASNYTPNNTYCVFNANFDGLGSMVNLNIDNEGRITGGQGGLFPVLGGANQNNTQYAYIISNLTLTGNVTASASAGGLCGYKYSSYININNVNAKDLTVNGLGNIIASPVIQGSGSTGGLIGVIRGNESYTTNINSGDDDKSTFENVTVHGLSAAGTVIGVSRAANIYNVTVKNSTVTSDNSYAGGVIGNKNQGIASYLDHISVTGTSVTADGNTTGAGGVIGFVGRNDAATSLHDIYVNNNTITASSTNSYAGKIYGLYSSNGTQEIGILKYDDTYDTTMKTVGNFDENSNSLVDIYYNDFHDLEKAEDLYKIHRYAQSEGETDQRYADLIDSSIFAQGTGSYDEEGNEIKNPIDLIPDNGVEDDYNLVKWSSDAGTIEQVLNSVLSSLTNGTGQLSSKYYNNINVDIVPMEVNNGVASKSTTNTPAISIVKSDGKFVINNNNMYDTYEKSDTNGNHIPGTYSLIKIKYSIGPSDHFTETITIPFFVSNMVNVDIYSRTVIGSEFSPEVMRNIKDTSVKSITKDSSYTVYTEYMYSYNRTDFDNLYMNKVFKMDNRTSPVIPVGTKLTLVDVTDDVPHTYYYDVATEIIEVPLSSFTDENGNHYQERDISNLANLKNNDIYSTVYFSGRHYTKYNRGVERYFIYVDCSKVAKEGNLTQLETQITPSIVDNASINNKEIFYIRERCRTTLSTYNPRFIGFNEEKINLSGNVVNKNTGIDLSALVYNKASANYWNYVRNNDYNNNNKFLEVAISFVNDEGERVLLPAGTRVKLSDSEEAKYETVKNTSNIYYFKDGADPTGYALDDITSDTVYGLNVSFDFGYAKMENLPVGNYRVCMELVRTYNKDFPMGDDTIQTIYSDPFQVTSSAEYGFRFENAENEKGIYNLAKSGDAYELHYNMLFSSTLPPTETADKNVVIKYRLFKKDKTTGEYAPYVNDGGLYPKLTYDSENINLDGEVHEYTISHVSSKDDENLIIPFTLELTKNMEPTNYKIEATVYVNDMEEAKDYMIFSISDID